MNKRIELKKSYVEYSEHRENVYERDFSFN